MFSEHAKMEVMNFDHPHRVPHQCIVCCVDCSHVFVDLSLNTSRTRHSNTPLEEKLQYIIKSHPVTSGKEVPVLCLPCNELINQFDALELQLNGVRRALCDKYLTSHGIGLHQPISEFQKNVTVRSPTAGRGKQVTTKRKTSVRGKKSVENSVVNLQQEQSQNQGFDHSKKNKVLDDNLLQWEQSPISTFDSEIENLPDIPGPSQVTNSLWTNATNGSDILVENGKQNVTQSLNVPQEKAVQTDKATVYDSDATFLNAGERYRIGVTLCSENSVSYQCCYCMEPFSLTELLKVHVRSHHNPQIITIAMPPNLGFGSKLNCGVHVQHVTVPSEMSKSFVCLFCDGAFKLKGNVMVHYKEKHSPHKPFMCCDCQEGFRRSIELSRHRVYYCPHRKKTQPKVEKKGKS